MFLRIFNKFLKNKNKNKIILHKASGETKIVSKISWLNIRFKGENSTIEIYEPYNFRRAIGKRCSVIKINGSNNYICFKHKEEEYYDSSYSFI